MTTHIIRSPFQCALGVDTLGVISMWRSKVTPTHAENGYVFIAFHVLHVTCLGCSSTIVASTKQQVIMGGAGHGHAAYAQS